MPIKIFHSIDIRLFVLLFNFNIFSLSFLSRTSEKRKEICIVILSLHSIYLCLRCIIFTNIPEAFEWRWKYSLDGISFALNCFHVIHMLSLARTANRILYTYRHETESFQHGWQPLENFKQRPPRLTLHNLHFHSPSLLMNSYFASQQVTSGLMPVHT